MLKAEIMALALLAGAFFLLLAAQPGYEPPTRLYYTWIPDVTLCETLEFDGEYASFYAAGEHWVVHESNLEKYGFGGI